MIFRISGHNSGKKSIKKEGSNDSSQKNETGFVVLSFISHLFITASFFPELFFFRRIYKKGNYSPKPSISSCLCTLSYIDSPESTKRNSPGKEEKPRQNLFPYI